MTTKFTTPSERITELVEEYGSLRKAAEEKARKLEEDRELQRQADEAAEEKRLANKRHCAKINNQIIEDLEKAGLTKDVAKQVVIAIASGKVSNTRISY